MLDKPTDAMIEAGCKAFRDPFAGDTAGDILRQKLCAIYLAMKALDATLTPDPVQSDGEARELLALIVAGGRLPPGRTRSKWVTLPAPTYYRARAMLTRLTSLSAPVEED